MPDLKSLRESASIGLKKAASATGLRNSEEDDALDDFCPKLSYQQRMIGFGSCFVLGYIITFLSFSFFIEMVRGDPAPFVMVYTLGNILSLLSSMFLCGPKRQLKNMIDEKRRYTTIVFMSSLLLAIIICFIEFDQGPKLFLLILLLIIQACASLWYSLSYIPFARTQVVSCMKGAFGMNDDST